MKLLELIIKILFDRMSAEDKTRLLESAADHFLAGMTAEEKEQLVERLIRRLLDDVDVKTVVPRIMAMMMKEAGDSALVAKMTRAAAQTGGKLSGVVNDLLRKE